MRWKRRHYPITYQLNMLRNISKSVKAQCTKWFVRSKFHLSKLANESLSQKNNFLNGFANEQRCHNERVYVTVTNTPFLKWKGGVLNSLWSLLSLPHVSFLFVSLLLSGTNSNKSPGWQSNTLQSLSKTS